MTELDIAPLPNLVIKREDAKSLIEGQFEKLEEIQNLEIRSHDDFMLVYQHLDLWHTRTVELLKRMLTNNSIANEFDGIRTVSKSYVDGVNGQLGYYYK